MNPDGLTITIDPDGDARVVTVAGELHSLTTGELTAALEPLLVEGADLKLDLAQVSFIDSFGLSCLLVARQTAHKNGGSLVVTGRSPRVDQVLEATGTLTLLTGESTRD